MSTFKIDGYRCVSIHYEGEIEAENEDEAYDIFWDNKKDYEAGEKLIEAENEDEAYDIFWDNKKDYEAGEKLIDGDINITEYDRDL